MGTMGRTTTTTATTGARQPTVKKKKVYIAFNEEARKDYLTGFRKRRQERKDHAHNMLEKKLQRKVKDERNKRRKTTQEKVDKLLQGINLPGDDNGEETGSSETVDFGSHEAVVTVCAGFGDSGLVLAPSENDEQTVSASANKNNMALSGA